MAGKLVTPFKVGLLVVVSFGAAAAFLQVISTRGVDTKSGYHVHAVFDDVLGLEKKSPVQIAGIDIGRIDKIALQDGRAKVTLMIDPEIKLYDNAKIAKVSISLLGDYKLRVTPGGGEGAVLLKDGDTLKNVESLSDTDAIIAEVRKSAEAIGTLIRGTPGHPAPLEEIVKDVQGSAAAARNVLEVVSEDIGANTARLEEILDNVKHFTKDMSEISAGKEADIAAILKDSRAIAKSIRVTSESLEQLVAGEQKGELKDSVRSLKGTLDTLNVALERIASVAGKIDSGEGSVGQLINSPSISNSIEEVVEGVGDVIGPISRLQTWVNLRSEFQFRGGAAKNYVQFTLMPKADKYYIFEVVDDPRGVRSTVISDVATTSPENGRDFQYRERKTTTVDGLKFSLEFAKRFYFLSLRFGIIEGTGGIGADAHFFKDRFEISLDANQFGIEARNPRLKALALVEIVPHVYLHGGVDDFLNPGTLDFFLGAGVRFNDEDLRTLLLAGGGLPKGK